MSENYVTLVPSYFPGRDRHAIEAQVAVTLEFAPAVTGPARLGLWSALMAHLARTGNWAPTESDAAIASWLAKVDARGYAPRITSSIATTRALNIENAGLLDRLVLGHELLALADGFPVRLRSLALLDFVGAGVFSPTRPPEIVAKRLFDPTPWANTLAERAALKGFAQAAMAVESWPGNRIKRYVDERPGLAALL